MIAPNQMSPHVALRKWTAQLGTPVPSNVWNMTWIGFWSAAENTFLWQIRYRIPATQRWRLPGRQAADPETWCSRCSLQVTEDLLHIGLSNVTQMLGMVCCNSLVGFSSHTSNHSSTTGACSYCCSTPTGLGNARSLMADHQSDLLLDHMEG